MLGARQCVWQPKIYIEIFGLDTVLHPFVDLVLDKNENHHVTHERASPPTSQRFANAGGKPSSTSALADGNLVSYSGDHPSQRLALLGVDYYYF